jgi:hypothetical protein
MSSMLGPVSGSSVPHSIPNVQLRTTLYQQHGCLQMTSERGLVKRSGVARARAV